MNFVSDTILFVGFGAMLYGVWQFSPAVMWIALGVGVMVMGLGIGGHEDKASNVTKNDA